MTTGSTAMAMEIESLRQQLHEVALDWQVTQQQLNILKDELKLISKTIDDPRVDLTMTMSEVILEMKQQLSDHIKRGVMLRDVVLETKKYLDQTYADLIGNLGAEWLAARIVDHLSPILSKALAATTTDLDGLILCEKEPCRDDGRCQYAIDHGAEGLGHCPEGKCCMPLYRAWEPK